LAAQDPADALQNQLQTGKLESRVHAAVELLRLGSAARAAYPALMRALSDDDRLDHLIAAHALFARPRSAVDATSLAAELNRGTKARVAAAWELSRIGPTLDSESVAKLIDALKYRDKHERNFLVLALATAHRPAPEVLPALLSVLADSGSDYIFPRATATVAIGMIGPAARAAAPRLHETVQDPGAWEYQRAAARWTLARIEDPRVGMAAGHDVRELVRALARGPRRCDAAVTDGLRSLGAFAGNSAPIAKKGTTRKMPAVHESIALAIGYLDSLSQPPTPHDISRQEENGKLSPEAMTFIMALGGVQQGIAQVLLECWAQADKDPRIQAVRALGALGAAAKESIPILRTATGDDDWILRREAITALRLIENPSGRAYLTPRSRQ
jgi:hypothetical protein